MALWPRENNISTFGVTTRWRHLIALALFLAWMSRGVGLLGANAATATTTSFVPNFKPSQPGLHFSNVRTPALRGQKDPSWTPTTSMIATLGGEERQWTAKQS